MMLTGNCATSSTEDFDSRSLLCIIIDVSPLAWGERDVQRTATDKARAAAGKRSVGPAVLSELLESIQAFCTAFLCDPDAGLILVGVADNECDILFPRRDVLNDWLQHPETYRPDVRQMRIDLITGVHELLQRSCRKANTNSTPTSRLAAMAAAFSTSMCVIYRFYAISTQSSNASAVPFDAGYASHSRSSYQYDETGGSSVIALSNGVSISKKRSRNHSSCAWAPRILLVQASEDRSRDYNAVMNCAFAAVKKQVTVDGCFLTTATGSSSSAFLEQVCDLTGGVFLAPSGAAQVDGALTEVLYSVFLSPVSCRNRLNLPSLNKVDFRARCFETGELVDMAHVCNLCLSLFKSVPQGSCPTCGATILVHNNPAPL